MTQDSVERYDADADQWVAVASLPHGLGHVQNTTVEVLVYDPTLDA